MKNFFKILFLGLIAFCCNYEGKAHTPESVPISAEYVIQQGVGDIAVVEFEMTNQYVSCEMYSSHVIIENQLECFYSPPDFTFENNHNTYTYSSQIHDYFLHSNNILRHYLYPANISDRIHRQCFKNPPKENSNRFKKKALCPK